MRVVLSQPRNLLPTPYCSNIFYIITAPVTTPYLLPKCLPIVYFVLVATSIALLLGL